MLIVQTGLAPNAQIIKATICAPKIMGSKVLMTPRATQRLENGLNACVPYELKIPTNTCRKTARKDQIHKWSRLASGKTRDNAPAISSGHSSTAGIEWVAPR